MSASPNKVRTQPAADPHGRAQPAVDPHGEDFKLISIHATPAPSGCVGRDWFVYRIAQGGNIITGYRQGDLATASADVETIVTALNGRRRSTKPKPGRKPGRRPADADKARNDEPE